MYCTCTLLPDAKVHVVGRNMGAGKDSTMARMANNGRGDRTSPVTIKKYANRRLYNTGIVELHHAGRRWPQMVRDGTLTSTVVRC